MGNVGAMARLDLALDLILLQLLPNHHPPASATLFTSHHSISYQDPRQHRLPTSHRIVPPIHQHRLICSPNLRNHPRCIVPIDGARRILLPQINIQIPLRHMGLPLNMSSRETQLQVAIPYRTLGWPQHNKILPSFVTGATQDGGALAHHLMICLTKTPSPRVHCPPVHIGLAL